MQNSLDSKVFQDNLDFKTLENILETLDHVTPKKIIRSDFDALKGNFLIETGEDKFGKQYDLFLPEDLVYGELLNLIDFLSRKFGIENYTPYSRIITKSKVIIGVILRGLGEEDGEKYLQELTSKYSISPEFINRLKSQKEGGEKMSFSEAKDITKSVKSKRKEDNAKKVGENKEDIVLGFDELKELYGEEFDLTFFRKGVNMLRLGMMTITQAEQEGLKEKLQRKGEKVTFHVSDEILDKQERLLRDKIGIDELKKELYEARISGDQERINETELKATNTILEILFEYPYIMTKENSGYQPNKIIKYKEVYCVGFNLLGHAFLTELEIKHNGLDIPVHSALEVNIGGINYYFDATWGKKVIEIEYGVLEGNYKRFKLKQQCKCNLAYSGDTDIILLSQLYNNKGIYLSIIGRVQEGINMFDKSIKINKKYIEAINNRKIVTNYKAGKAH